MNSTLVALPSRPRVAVRYRLLGLVAVTAALVIVGGSSAVRVRKALQWLRRGARPASATEAAKAYAMVAAASRCAGRHACLTRSVAVVFACRLAGTWATWVLGVRTSPFTAHAWAEADGRPVGEESDPNHHYARLVVVGPEAREGSCR